MISSRQAVTKSSAFGAYIGENLIDNNYYTSAATSYQSNNWMNVRISPSEIIGYVSLHWANIAYVGSLEVYVTNSDGPFSGPPEQICGANPSPSGYEWTVWCGYAQANSILNEGGGRYVGVRRALGAASGFLILTQMGIYEPGAYGYLLGL